MAQIAQSYQYSDLNFLFRVNPNNEVGDISTVKDTTSIKQSVLNILKTNHGERPFNPFFGANLRSFLFESIDYITAVAIANQIKNAIFNDEPRVKVLNVNIKTKLDDNEVNITLTIQIIATNEVTSIETTLERIR